MENKPNEPVIPWNEREKRTITITVDKAYVDDLERYCKVAERNINDCFETMLMFFLASQNNY